MTTPQNFAPLHGLKSRPGETLESFLKISESFMAEPIRIPVTIIHGRAPGPTVFIFAAMHGNEINGVDIVRRLIYDLDHSTTHGIIVAVPVVNVQGFHSQTRHLPDNRDLNRYFPGNATGSLAKRVAATLFRNIVQKCDYGIDLHTAGEGRMNLPQVRADLSNPKVSRLARSTGAAVIIDHAGHRGSLRKEATDAGVPTILFEAGEPGRFDPRASQACFKGILNLLHALGVRPADPPLGVPFEPPFQIIVRNRKWIRARHGGILELKVKPGDLVYRGDAIGTIFNPFGKVVKHVRADRNGIVIGTSVQPLVLPGTAIAHIAHLRYSLSVVEKYLLPKAA